MMASRQLRPTSASGTPQASCSMVTLGLLVLVGLGAALASSTKLAYGAMPFNTDCMKNPFATGCRGISAKRSPQQPQEVGPLQMGRRADVATATVLPLYELVMDRANLRQSARARQQFNSAVDLLVEAASRLASIGPPTTGGSGGGFVENSSSRGVGKRAGEEPAQRMIQRPGEASD